MEIKLKAKTKKNKIVKLSCDAINWFTCPHCKKIVFLSSPEVSKQLKSWKKQK